MKRMIRFHKAFLPAAIFSAVLITLGLVGLFAKGFNLGVDFRAGLNQYVKLVFPAASVTYEGEGSPVLSLSDSTATVVFSGADVQGRTLSYDLRTVGTIADLAVAMKADGITLAPRDGGLSADLLVPTYQGDYVLSANPVLVHRTARAASELYGSVEDIRAALASVGDVSVQAVGAREDSEYIVRIQDKGTVADFSTVVPPGVIARLNEAFGADRAITMKTDYVGARFSQDLASSSGRLIILTLLVIMIYATVRFKLQFAIGAVMAIIHDGLIMMGFIVWSGMEFNTSSIAAILTILGYSINDTIVIFDRIREDRRLNPTDKMTTILDKSISETMGRTVITILTTMVTVLALYFFTSGSIKDFALALFVGMISGTYSTIFIASGFVSLWDKLARKRGDTGAAKAPALTPAP